MAKVKNKRNSGLADRVNKKKKGDVQIKKLNPFEVHINREKLKVLGKKSKHDRGLPGVSRAKAIQKRKETLGTEMKLMHKTNAFIDKRIGEKDSQLTSEERIVARFAAERAKQHKKKDIYNLADDEILTHRGQTLEQIEKFDDPRSDDEDDDDRRKFGGLDDDFVSDGHFGGGVLSKTSSKDGEKSHKDLIEQLIAESKKRKAEKQKEKEQTLDLTDKLDTEWKDLQPVVFKRPRVEEQTLIDKLLIEADKKNQDYDKMMRELKFDRRGTPSDGLKSEEKQLKEEQKRLEQLERERQQRMLGEEGDSRRSGTVGTKHRSADDLDDNFELDNEQDFMLAYDKDGNPLVPEHIFKANHVPNAQKKYEDGISDSSSDEEGDDDEEDDDDDEESEENDDIPKSQTNDKKKSNEESILFQKGDDKETSDESSDDDDEEESDKVDEKTKPEHDSKVKAINVVEINNSSEDDEIVSEENIKSKKFSGTKEIGEDSDESSSDDDDIKTSANITVKSKTNIDTSQEKSNKTADKSKDEKESGKKTVKINTENKVLIISDKIKNITPADLKKTKDSSNDDSSENDDDDQSSDDDENDDKNNKFDDLQSESESEDDGEVKEKLTSVFNDRSKECDNLRELLKDKNPTEHATALKQLIKTYDPSLAADNKEILSRLFTHILQYINEIFTNLQTKSDIVKSFLIFDKIAPFLYDLAHLNKVSSKKYLAEVIKEKRERFFKNSKKIPDLDTLIFFKVVSLIYPTSDYQHPVATPSFIFMSEILSFSRFRDVYSISRGLFITALVLEYTVLSKRLLPAALNFIRGILFLSATTSILNPIQIIPPFKMHKDVKFLLLEDDCSGLKIGTKMAASDLVLNSASNEFKIRCLSTSVGMLKEFFDNSSEYSAQGSLFEPHLQLLGRLDLDVYPKKLQERIKGVMDHMKQSLEMKTYTPMTRERKRPKALRLYEPDVQAVFTGGKDAKLSREMAEKNKLEHKYKKEMKGALREIRRDKAYIAAVKMRQKIHNDNIRKDKVKQIYKEASVQQGELNKLKRMK